MQPLQYAIYKGTGGKFGAIQFRMQVPHFYNENLRDFSGSQALDETGRLREGWKTREGAIFLEIANTKDKNVYDWENKTVMALSPTDMGRILHCLITGEECKLMHDPGAKSDKQGVVKKFLNISSPKGTSVGALLSVTNQAGEEQKNYMVPIDGSEVIVLRTLLQAAVARALAWA